MTFPARQPLPLTLGDIDITADMLHGYNYYSGVPTVLQSFLRHQTSQMYGWSMDNTVIYMGPGYQRMFTISARGWLPGARLLATASDSVGNYVIVLLRVISYNPLTGELWFENLYQNLLVPNLAANWNLTCSFPDTLLSAPLAVASGGTGASDVSTARTNALKGRQRFYWDVTFDDFIGTPVCGVQDMVGNTFSLPSYLATSPDIFNHPGCAQLSVAALNTDLALRINPGRLVFGQSGAAPCGANTLFETDIYLPALSTVTQGYNISVGLSGSNANSYFKLQYTHSLNAGAWTMSNQPGAGGDNSTATAITVAAATWYKISFAPDGDLSGHIVVKINGTTVSSALGMTDYSPCHWNVRMKKTIGSGAVSAYVDYMLLRQNIAALLPRGG